MGHIKKETSWAAVTARQYGQPSKLQNKFSTVDAYDTNIFKNIANSVSKGAKYLIIRLV